MKIPRSAYNWISATGLILALNCILLIIILFVISLTISGSNTYLGIFIYIVLPAVLVIGLILIPIGMLVNLKKARRMPETGLKWPVFDMNNQKHRRSVLIVSAFTLVFVLVSAMGSYQAYNYTESVEFCGKLCHSVMEPEYVTYLNSPHARVRCVECHVGEGASWYVKSKLSGLYQVYSVLFHKYSTPIPTPLENLRPATETCEKCHWPQKFYERKLRNQRGFLSDSSNSHWNIAMMMKIGPSFSAYGLREGIHWHINPDVSMEYVASTADRETIPWIKLTNRKTGETQVFQDKDNVLPAAALDSLEKRSMDCMDCHNRPSHAYKSANVYMDNALISGIVPEELPFIKKASMKILGNQFSTVDSAMLGIRNGITEYYQNKKPEVYTAHPDLIEKAITGIQGEFRKNTFPSMKASSSSYLNHIGHLESDGCFRCHSGRHVNESGKTISKDCNLCHTIIAQGSTEDFTTVSYLDTLEFRHPIDIGTAWQEVNCTECHRSM
jgi:nitrate/TMAO reductase-like tetraheme cytochrome c subunit